MKRHEVHITVDGALVSFGDGHAWQGDGEACGVAVEIATHTTFTVDVITDNPVTTTPRVESDGLIMSVGWGRPLEDAYRMAHCDLVGWVAELTGLDTLDAYQLVSQAATTVVGNVCDPAYTVVARFPKTLLRDETVYGGVHTRLRQVIGLASGGTA